MTSRNIVIIGGGPAGVFAAIEAKRRDAQAEVTLLSEEPCEPYERPPLSKAVLLGKARAADAPIAGPKGLAGHGVNLHCDTRCTAIDRAALHVVTAYGARLPYDALVIATGSVVRQIPVLPLGAPRIHYLRTEAHAQALATELTAARHLAVIGGGLIGLEVAASAAELGVRATVIEVLPRILARVCDEEVSARVSGAAGNTLMRGAAAGGASTGGGGATALGGMVGVVAVIIGLPGTKLFVGKMEIGDSSALAGAAPGLTACVATVCSAGLAASF